MPRFWTCHWRSSVWEVNKEYEPIDCSGSNLLKKRGVKAGDTVFIVSLRNGRLLLGGSMIVKDVVRRKVAVRRKRTTNLWPAKWIAMGKEGTQLHLHRRLTSSLAKELRFISKSGKLASLSFADRGQIDNQATRRILELTSDSAVLLSKAIKLSDDLRPSDGKLIAVTKKMVFGEGRTSSSSLTLANSLRAMILTEGDERIVMTVRYYRNKQARKECIDHYGLNCWACGVDFSQRYHLDVAGLIHVHHLKQMSKGKGRRKVDPIRDLRPICPNCHAVLHWKDSPFTLAQLRKHFSKLNSDWLCPKPLTGFSGKDKYYVPHPRDCFCRGLADDRI